jgi:RNA polymerase sigma factor (sigma-70 family)
MGSNGSSLWISRPLGRQRTGGSVKPVMAAAAASTEAREEELVASAQAGNVEAFETLFRRYRDRITSFVRASIRDDGRTEDIVQEIFFSAHSSLSSLSNPAAFRTWLYQIARNACLDEARRRSRQDELIYGWDEFPPPDDRIVVHYPDAERAFSQKEELADLTQALDGLPPTQHEALVLRELEGRSYDEIGRRMRLSKTAVESVLFRARRGLKGEYIEIQTGERCKRMQAVMARVAEGMGDLRERRKLIRHMRDCTNCRREASALGLSGLAVPSDDRRGLERAFSRLASFLPLPAFFSRRPDETEQLASGSSFAAQAQGAAAQLSTVSADHAVSVVHKAAAVVAAVAVVGGGGVAIHKAGVKFPVIDSIVKKHDAKPGAAAGNSAQANLPTAATGGGSGPPGKQSPGGPAESTPSGIPIAGSSAPTGAEQTAGTPATFVSPDPGSPGGTDTPGTGSGDNKTTTDNGNGGKGAGSGSTETGSGSDSGGTKPKKKDGDPGSTDTGATAPTDSILQLLPPGIARQIESGKRTVDDLPPGQKKKIPPPADPAAAAPTT